MINLITLTQFPKEVQNNPKNKEKGSSVLQSQVPQLKPTLNPSISSQKVQQDQNSSISQQILKYTNELKNFFISKLSEPQKEDQIGKNQFQVKMRTQSSKNVQKGKDGNKKHNRNAKSAKNVKIQSKSSTSQQFYLSNNPFVKKSNQKQSVQDHLKLTSLSKIVQRTQKENNMRPRHSSQVLVDLERRLSKLETLMQTILDQKTVNFINPKGNSVPNFKQTTKTIFRRKPFIGFQRKKHSSLQNQIDKQNNCSKKKIQKKVDTTKNSSKMLEKGKLKRNFKQNQRPLCNLKKSNMKLNNNYQSIIDYNAKSPKKVLFAKSKGQNNYQGLDQLQKKQK